MVCELYLNNEISSQREEEKSTKGIEKSQVSWKEKQESELSWEERGKKCFNRSVSNVAET